MSRGSIAAALWVLASAAPAAAQRLYARADLDVRANVGTLDLAEQAGAEPSDDSQTSPALGGFALAVGVRSADVSIGVEAALYLGGLDLAEIEELYFGAEPQSIGSASTALVGLAASVERPARDRLVWVGRLGLGYSLMSASSPAGSARVETFYMDIGGGVGLELGTSIPSRIEAIAALRVHRLNRLNVDNLTEGRIAADAPAVFAQPGVVLGYVVMF